MSFSYENKKNQCSKSFTDVYVRYNLWKTFSRNAIKRNANVEEKIRAHLDCNRELLTKIDLQFNHESVKNTIFLHHNLILIYTDVTV